MNIRPFTNALRKNGVWRKDYDSRAGGGRVVQFVRRVNLHRFLELQLWSDGEHRVSFMEDGRMATPPTAFSDVPGMLRAIEIEKTRPAAPRCPWCSSPHIGSDCKSPRANAATQANTHCDGD